MTSAATTKPASAPLLPAWGCIISPPKCRWCGPDPSRLGAGSAVGSGRTFPAMLHPRGRRNWKSVSCPGPGCPGQEMVGRRRVCPPWTPISIVPSTWAFKCQRSGHNLAVGTSCSLALPAPDPGSKAPPDTPPSLVQHVWGVLIARKWEDFSRWIFV